MASAANFILKAYKTEANARANTNPLAVDSLSSASGSTIDNPSQATGYGFWAFQRYWYRIESNEPVSEFHIDWDDGEDNSPKKANVSIIKNDKPSFVGIVSHIFTQSKSFYPLIRVKSVQGFLSKWYTPYSTANNYNGLDDDIKTDGYDKGQNSFSVVSIEKNNPSASGDLANYARIPVFKPANISPIGVLKTDRKKVFAGMDNVWLGNNSRVLTGSGATEMPYSHTVNAICSNPNRTGSQAKVTYQEGRIGGVSAITEATTNEWGTYIPPPGSPAIRGFNANDLDQKLIYITSMDETYACYFTWTDGADPSASANSTIPVPSAPYSVNNTELVEVNIPTVMSTGGNTYVTAEDLATRLTAVLNDKTYHGRDEFTSVASNATSEREVFRVAIDGDGFSGSNEISPASNTTANDGLSAQITNSSTRYGNYFTFSTPTVFGITPTNFYAWMRQLARKEQFVVDVSGDSFMTGSPFKEKKLVDGGATGDDGLATRHNYEGYGNYFNFSCASDAAGGDYYAWFRQAVTNEELRITVTGDNFSSGSEISAASGSDGLTAWHSGVPVGKYFQFRYAVQGEVEKDYVVYFEQDGISEKTQITVNVTPNATELEDEYITLYDEEDTKYVVWFQHVGGIPWSQPTVSGTTSYCEIEVNDAWGNDDIYDAMVDGTTGIGGTASWNPSLGGGGNPFTVTGTTPRVVVEVTNVGNCIAATTSDNVKLAVNGIVDGKDKSVSPAETYHNFAGSPVIIGVGYDDGASEGTIATELQSQLNTSFGTIDGLSVALANTNEVTITASGELKFISSLDVCGTAFSTHDGLASSACPVDLDLSTKMTFTTVTQGKNLSLDPAGKESSLSGRIAIPVDYEDYNTKTQIATKLNDALNGSSAPISSTRSTTYVTVLNDNGGVVIHAADGTDDSSTDNLDLSTGFDVTTNRIDGKDMGLSPLTPHNSRLNGFTAIPIDYNDGDTKAQVTTKIYNELNRGCPLSCVWAEWFTVTQVDSTTIEVTLTDAGQADDVEDGSASPTVDLGTDFTFSFVTDATGRYKVVTTHTNKGVIPAPTLQPSAPGVAPTENSTNCVPNDTPLFEMTDSGASPPAYYAPRVLTDGVDPSDGSIKQKTLTCVAPVDDGENVLYQAGSRLSNVAKILKMELVNNLENSDSYGGSTGTSTLVPGERIYLQTTLNPTTDNKLPSRANRLDNRNLSGTICSVSLGSPIVEENLIGSKLSVDATESKVRCSNKSISYFYIDDNKLISGDITEGATDTGSHQSADTNNITDKLVGGSDFKSTNGTKDLWYTFDWWREHQDANYRYYPYKRLIRAQIEDNHGTTTPDDAFNLSPIVHWDSSTYLTIGAADELPDGQPSDIAKWNYGVFLFTNQAKLRTPNWVDLNANNREDRIPIFSTDRDQDVSNKLGNSSAFDTLSGDVAHYAPDNRYDANATEDMDTIDSVGPRNALFMARKEKFDRIFVRVSHDRLNAAGGVISDLVSDITVGSTQGWPKMRMQVLYPAKKTRNSSTIIWKPLPIIDRTMIENKEDSSLYKSGDIVFIPPVDWEKTSHSANIEYPYEDNFFDDGTASGTNGIDDKWDKESYALIFLITQIASNVETIKNVFNVMSMYPYNNAHSQLIEVVDPTHVSLNNFGVAQSVAFVRKGKYQEIKDRSGISLMRRVGAEGGQIKLGGIDLKGDTEAMRAKFYEFQKDSVPVYYDVTHKDDSITRLFGVMTDMSEDHPTSGLIPKFACNLTVTHILEIDSSGNITGKGYKPLGGDAIDVEQYLSTS